MIILKLDTNVIGKIRCSTGYRFVTRNRIDYGTKIRGRSPFFIKASHRKKG